MIQDRGNAGKTGNTAKLGDMGDTKDTGNTGNTSYTGNIWKGIQRIQWYQGNKDITNSRRD